MRWKPVKGYKGEYEVSDQGDVKSLERHIENGSPKGMILPERILRQTQNKNGYYQVSLMHEGKRKVAYVHRLVAEAFVPKIDGNVINHKNGDKSDNRAKNLEFVTYSTNNQEAYDMGLRGKSRKDYKKLDIDTVKEIRKNGKCDTYENLSKKYGISPTGIKNILEYIYWKNIE